MTDRIAKAVSDYVIRAASVDQYLNPNTIHEDVIHHGFLCRDYAVLSDDPALDKEQRKMVREAWEIYQQSAEKHWDGIQTIVDVLEHGGLRAMSIDGLHKIRQRMTDRVMEINSEIRRRALLEEKESE